MLDNFPDKNTYLELYNECKPAYYAWASITNWD